MKKTKVLSLISLLLILAMMLVACSDNSSTNKEPQKPGGGSNTTVENDYSKNIPSWTKYIEYITPESKPVFNEARNPVQTDGVQVYGNIIVTSDVTEHKKTVEEAAVPTEKLVYTVVTWKFLNANTGALIKSFITNVPNVEDVAGVPTVDADYVLTNGTRYSFDELDGVIEVTEEKLTLKTVEEGQPQPDPSLYESYEWTVSAYDYYLSSGTLLAGNLEEKAVMRHSNTSERRLLDAADKTYLYTTDGELIYTFNLRMEYDLPTYDPESKTPTSLTDLGYAYFETDNYVYVVTEAFPSQVPMGDIYMSLTRNVTITVMDKDYNIVMRYEPNCYAIFGYTVLPGGHVYVCEAHQLNENVEEYDVENGGQKLRINHLLLNVETKSVSAIERGYFPHRMFSERTKLINSYMNVELALNAASLENSLLASVKVKDDYILAEVQKYSEGKLEPSTVFAILDKDMNIVEELPKILPNQVFFPGFLDSTTILVDTMSIENKMTVYAIDTQTGEASLFPKNYATVKAIEGGYFYKYKVYDRNWNVIHDFNEDDDVSGFTVIDGMLYFRDDGDIYRYSISGKSGEKRLIKSVNNNCSATFSENCDYISYIDSSGNETLYNLDGNVIIGYKQNTVYKYSEILEESVSYICTERIYQIVEIDDGYLVTVSVSLRRNYTASEEDGLPDSESYYKYYFIK